VIAVGHRALAPGALAARLRDRLAREAPALLRPFDTLAGRLAYVHGGLEDGAVYQALRDALARAGARHPLHYLAVPPAMFEPVVQGLGASGLASGARVAIEKPFGHDLDSALALERAVRAVFPDDAIFRIDHYLAKDPVRNLADMRARSAWLRAVWSREHVHSVQVTMAEAFGIGTRGAFYESTGVLRDVFQNHLLQLVAIAVMEPAPLADAAALGSARVAALRALRPLAPADVVYGQYDGYRSEPGVAPQSQVATYLAVRLAADAPRMAGVPIYVRGGKRLACTATMLTLVLHGGERLRFRLGPGHARIALDTQRLRPGSETVHEPLTLEGVLPDDEDRDAYVNILRAVVRGDHGIAEHAAGVEAAWRVVQGVLDAPPPVHPYPQGSFGPPQADTLLAPGDRWLDPLPA
jgi:glucose-6-phosphate 1-dehydrogenase